jgi:hypothetical protein
MTTKHYQDLYYTKRHEIESVLISFLQKQYPAIKICCQRQSFGGLRIFSETAVLYNSETNTYTSVTMNWHLQEIDVENVMAAISCKRYSDRDILLKFNHKFLVD